MRMTDKRLEAKAATLAFRLDRHFKIESIGSGLRSFVDITEGHNTIFTDTPGRLWEKMDAYVGRW